ncbi:MAG: hypothetical protein ACK587_02115 [Cyanobacteriota bacterium]
MSLSEEAALSTKTIKDCFGFAVRLTVERMAHILEHPEMNEMRTEIEQVLAAPQIVHRSRSEEQCGCFMRSTRRRSSVANGCVWL